MKKALPFILIGLLIAYLILRSSKVNTPVEVSTQEDSYDEDGIESFVQGEFPNVAENIVIPRSGINEPVNQPVTVVTTPVESNTATKSNSAIAQIVLPPSIDPVTGKNTTINNKYTPWQPQSFWTFKGTPVTVAAPNPAQTIINPAASVADKNAALSALYRAAGTGH
jgi:hypothetical protein